MRFLISRLSSLGDVVCTLPAAPALKSAFPQSSVTWIVDRRFSGVVRCSTAVDKVVEMRRGLKREDWPELAESFDVAFDLQGLLKSAWPIRLSRAREKLGYHWQREGASLFSSKVLPDPSSFHIVDQYLDVVRAAGANPGKADFGLRPSVEANQTVKARLQEDGIEDYVVLNPGAAWETKRWPTEHWAGLAGILGTAGIKTVLIGGSAPAEMQGGADIQARSSYKPLSWIGKTSVEELIAAIANARAYVGGDTGSTHIAAALSVPCVGLYSVTNPRRSCPYGQIDRCLYRPALGDITPQEVFTKLGEVLN